MALVEFTVELLQAMQGQSSLVIDCDLKGLLHKLLADRAHLRVQRRREHHHLLLVRRLLEDGLNIGPHVESCQHVVTLIQDKVLEIGRVEVLAADECQNAAGCAHNNRRRVFLESSDVLGDRLATIHNLDRHFLLVVVSRKSIVFFFDLERELAGMTHDQHGEWLGVKLELVERAQNEHGSLAHA